MSDKLYTSYGEDKLLDLENQNIVSAFQNAIGGDEPVCHRIDMNATVEAANVKIDGEAATPKEVYDMINGTEPYVIHFNGQLPTFFSLTPTDSGYLIYVTAPGSAAVDTNNQLVIIYGSIYATTPADTWDWVNILSHSGFYIVTGTSRESYTG